MTARIAYYYPGLKEYKLYNKVSPRNLLNYWTVKRFWKVVSGFLLAFLVFAPPGTMIFIGLFLIWLLRDSWWGIAFAVLGAAAAAALILKFIHQRRRDESKN